MKYFKLLLVGLFSCYAFSQNNQNYSFTRLSNDLEKSQFNVFSITQDSLGYMWIAGANGLYKYDGKSIKTHPKNFVSESDIIIYDKKLYTDKEQNTWIITGERSIEKLNPKQETFHQIRNIPLPKVMFQSDSLNLFFGTSNNGIFKVDKKNDTLQILNKSDFPNNVNEFAEYNNNVWASSTSGIFQILQDDTYKKYIIPNVKNNDYTVIGASKTQGLFVGTYMNNLYKYNEQKDDFEVFTGFKNHPFVGSYYIHNLFFDSRDRLWIGTYGQGLFLVDFENKTINNFKPDKQNPNTIPYDCITSIYEDATKNIWIATDGGGLCIYDEKLVKFNSLTNINVPKSVNINLVKSIDLDVNNGLWIGTHNYGIVYSDSTRQDFKLYTKENSGLNSNKIAHLKTIKNELWIANETPEIQILKPDGRFKTFGRHTTPKLDVEYIYSIFQDSKHRIWLSTSNKGLLQFDAKHGVVDAYSYDANNQNSVSSNLIYSIAEDEQQNIWIGTKYKGLCKIDPIQKKVVRFSKFKGLARSLFVDKDNMIWIGTNSQGLLRFNPNTNELIPIDKTVGLNESSIFGILNDDENLWLSTNNGITRFNSKTNDYEHFTKHDGLQSSSFSTRAAIKDIRNNTLYFGGPKGVNWFKPTDISKNEIEPKTVITKIEVNDIEHYEFESESLNYKQNTLNFTFASLHYSSPDRNIYKYKLVNYDEDWKSSGKTNFVRYTNLPPNDYEFQVISSNYDGVWNDEPATYSFTILKPWYGTNLAYTIYGLIVLSSLYFFFRYLKWRIQIKNELEFEQKEAVRLKQLDEFKNRLFTNISHEFRTPLTLISGPVENQLAKPNLSSEDKEELSLVKRNAARLLNLVNQILDISKLETGNLKLSVTQDNLELNLKQLVSTFKFKAQKKQIDFTYNIQPTQMVWFDKDVVDKITINLLSNAIKYTPQNGFVRFESFVENGHVSISVTNNGVSYSSEDLQKLFKRYYQAGKNSDGTGIGLALVKELAILSHGNVVAHMLNNDEIQFTATLPIERSYFNASELTESPSTSSNDEEQELINDEQLQLDKETPNTKQLVLLVEDDDDIRQYVKSFLSKSYKVIEAVNGKEGINKAVDTIPDIIISDVMMPLEDGIGLCNTLKQNEKTSHIPIILLTAKAGNEHEISGLKVGADAYVTKPFHKEKLLVQIESLLNIRQQLQKKYSQNFKLKELALTNTEQQFLEKLYQVLNNSITENSFSAEILSKKMLMSRMQLHRKLKALTGLSTTEFITKERLTLSLPLLEKSDATIAEIAYQTGFNSPSYFSTCFKKHYNSTPEAYRSS